MNENERRKAKCERKKREKKSRWTIGVQTNNFTTIKSFMSSQAMMIVRCSGTLQCGSIGRTSSENCDTCECDNDCCSPTKSMGGGGGNMRIAFNYAFFPLVAFLSLIFFSVSAIYSFFFRPPPFKSPGWCSCWCCRYCYAVACWLSQANPQQKSVVYECELSFIHLFRVGERAKNWTQNERGGDTDF